MTRAGTTLTLACSLEMARDPGPNQGCGLLPLCSQHPESWPLWLFYVQQLKPQQSDLPT